MEHRQINENYRAIAEKLIAQEQVKTVIFHELLHVGIEPGADGEETYSVRKHDLEDFKEIIDRYGTDWASAARRAE